MMVTMMMMILMTFYPEKDADEYDDHGDNEFWHDSDDDIRS